MAKLVLNLPEGLSQAISLTPDELEAQVRLMAAIKMFELGKLSSGKAAELAGLSKTAFLDACGRYRVSPFNYPPEAVEDELSRELSDPRAGCGPAGGGQP